MKTTQYQPFWVLERVLYLSHYWYQKEYLDINEENSISTILSIGKSTLFFSLLASKWVGYWRVLDGNISNHLALPDWSLITWPPPPPGAGEHLYRPDTTQVSIYPDLYHVTFHTSSYIRVYHKSCLLGIKGVLKIKFFILVCILQLNNLIRCCH